MSIQANSLITILAGAETTAGRAALIESIERPNEEPPCHRHHEEDKLLYVLDGEITLFIDGRWQPAPRSTAVVIPRGAEHTFTVMGEQARLLTVFIPGGFEGFYRELGPGTPWLCRDGNSVERQVATAARYGCEVTGPHPGRTPRETGYKGECRE